MLAVIALVLGVVAVQSDEVEIPEWQHEHTFDSLMKMDTLIAFNAWSSYFERDYKTTEEESTRFIQFVNNLYDIARINSQELSYKLRLNQFGDMTGDEFRRYVHGDAGSCFRPDQISNSNGVDVVAEALVSGFGPPASVDWSSAGDVTPVKNQGQCGSCWAFSTTGALECQYAIKHGQLTSLSEQQLVDCAGRTYGCSGCNGGSMSGAMKYTSAEGGLCTESAYHYTARDGSCKASTCGTKHNHNTGERSVTAFSSSALETATAGGCVSIAIEADQTTFQHYSSGVFSGTCGTRLDHGVLVVGYGTEGGQQYWKVKNSWGTSWGERGYILICRNCNKNGRDGECGILMEPVYPTF